MDLAIHHLACVCGGFCVLLIPLAGIVGYKGVQWARRWIDDRRIKHFDNVEDLIEELHE